MTGSVDAAIERHVDAAFDFLLELVATPSVSGDEAAAQAVVADWFERAGLSAISVEIPDGLAEDGAAGFSERSYEGRGNVLAMSPTHDRPTLLLNGHIDTVPAESSDQWQSAPFSPRRDGDRLYGRGVGDMKCGFAMAWLALMAIGDAAPGVAEQPIGFLSVIEEESTGNGTLGSLHAGVIPESVIVCEPTNLSIMLACPGVLWVEITIEGLGGHAEISSGGGHPVVVAMEVLEAIAEFVEGLNRAYPDPLIPDLIHPYNVNVGRLNGGDWPSSIPTRLTIGLRVGFPRVWPVKVAEDLVRATVTDALDSETHSVSVRFNGLRARGYSLPAEHDLVERLSRAHTGAVGAAPARTGMAATTDARFYINEYAIPALCYGPVTGRIHGVDEYVDLPSIVDGARTLARFAIDYFEERP